MVEGSRVSGMSRGFSVEGDTDDGEGDSTRDGMRWCFLGLASGPADASAGDRVE